MIFVVLELAYNIPLSLRNTLSKIDSLRVKILLTPLSAKTEQRLRWETMLSRLYHSLALEGTPLSKGEIEKLVASTAVKMGPVEKRIIGYKKALDFLDQNWRATYHQTVIPETVLTLYRFLGQGKFPGNEAALKPFLDYLQINPENPVIAAALAQIRLIDLTSGKENSKELARLLAYLMLYKEGYDFGGLLSLEEYWHKDQSFREIIQRVLGGDSLNLWLEYFSQATLGQLEEAVANLNSTPLSSSGAFWELNDRQKEILGRLVPPGATITNRKVQQIFKVSQITASRDLAKLAALGLVLAQGHGRSVYYRRG